MKQLILTEKESETLNLVLSYTINNREMKNPIAYIPNLKEHELLKSILLKNTKE